MVLVKIQSPFFVAEVVELLPVVMVIVVVEVVEVEVVEVGVIVQITVLVRIVITIRQIPIWWFLREIRLLGLLLLFLQLLLSPLFSLLSLLLNSF